MSANLAILPAHALPSKGTMVALPPKSDSYALRHEHSERLLAVTGALRRPFRWIASEVLVSWLRSAIWPSSPARVARTGLLSLN